MKNLVHLIIFSFILCSFNSFAQLDLGVKAGFNFQDINIKDFDGRQTIDQIESGEKKTGFHAGLFANINIAVIQLRPEFLFTYVNHSVTSTSFSGEIKNFDFQFNRLDVPLLVGWGLGPLRLNTGPVMSFAISSTGDAFNKGIRDATWGYQAGLGLDLGQFIIDIRYEGAFSKTADNITIDGQDFATDARTSQILISLGYNFLD